MNDLENAQTKFESRLVEWYKNGASSVLGSLVTSGDLGDFLDVMYYTDAIIESDKETIVFIQDQQGQIYSQRETLYSEISEYDNLLEQMRKDEERLAELRQSRYSRLSEIADDVDQAEEALSELEASSYEIAMMLQVSRYTGTSGPLIKPVDAPFGSGFGMRNHPILGRNRMHEGQDFPAPAGTPIHAAGNGLVVHSGWKRGYGYTIIIDHGNGLATLYGHCSALLVGVGETINRGQVIARVGTTGLSTGNHLHFEVRINGDPTDPVPYITGN
jgi:murein DD-endopeptidase MepM/ murein hydrolase activator NlpD